jgi:hypothetical protein
MSSQYLLRADSCQAARSRRTIKLTRRRKRRLGARNERKAEAVGGRVQRLVVLLVRQASPDCFYSVLTLSYCTEASSSVSCSICCPLRRTLIETLPARLKQLRLLIPLTSSLHQPVLSALQSTPKFAVVPSNMSVLLLVVIVTRMVSVFFMPLNQTRFSLTKLGPIRSFRPRAIAVDIDRAQINEAQVMVMSFLIT